jgi:hypothetical protein
MSGFSFAIHIASSSFFVLIVSTLVYMNFNSPSVMMFGGCIVLALSSSIFIVVEMLSFW